MQRKWKRDRDRKLFTERALWGAGFTFVAGVDEVGMGPLAGPVVAAAVILPSDIAVDGIGDSKTIPRAKREALARQIEQMALAIGIGSVEVEEIEQINIYQSGLLAMRRAVAALSVVPHHLLIDARRIPGLRDPADLRRRRRRHRVLDRRRVDRRQGVPRPADVRARRALSGLRLRRARRLRDRRTSRRRCAASARRPCTGARSPRSAPCCPLSEASR